MSPYPSLWIVSDTKTFSESRDNTCVHILQSYQDIHKSGNPVLPKKKAHGVKSFGDGQRFLYIISRPVEIVNLNLR